MVCRVILVEVHYIISSSTFSLMYCVYNNLFPNKMSIYVDMSIHVDMASYDGITLRRYQEKVFPVIQVHNIL